MQNNFHYKLLTLLASFSLSVSSFGVELSTTQKGGAIFVPMYSAANGNSTLLTISNAGRHASAVKVLFLDQTGEAVSGLNLYLTVNDTWVMSLSSAPLSSNDQGTQIVIPDSSCTVPYLFETGSAASTLNLPVIGQILITDMGVVDGATQSYVAITDDTLLPRDCGRINDNWAAEGVWSSDPAFDMLQPTESIHAEVQIINVPEGTVVTVPGLVLTDFSDISLHSGPNELLPDLSSTNSGDSAFQGGAKSYVAASNGNFLEDDWADPIDAVSVLLTSVALSSVYTAEPGIGATAEWVLSFPTLKYYEGEQGGKDFSNETISYESKDRNGKRTFFCQPPIVGYPYCEPDGEFALEDYLLAIGSASESQFGLTTFEGKNGRSHDIADAGQISILMYRGYQSDTIHFSSQNGNDYYGLPVFAFGVQKYINSYLTGPGGEQVLANYRTDLKVSTEKFHQNNDLPAPTEHWGHNIRSTALAVNIGEQKVTATIVLNTHGSLAASFEIGNLEILAVRGESGPLRYKAGNGRLDIGMPSFSASHSDSRIEVDYHYKLHDNFDGAMASGVTMLWPYFCGNLYPCKSNPSESLTFEMSLSNFDSNKVAVYPKAITSQATSYQIGWAIGDYKYMSLGTTDAGTKVGVWYLAGNQTNATAGTTSLAEHFNWFEKTYGPYPFGKEVASVEAPWGTGATGGVEHHPYWHIATDSMNSALIHTHEAAHGWFGDGIRIDCWADFVMSEGTSTYLAARAVEAVNGQTAGDKAWAVYANLLQEAQQSAVHKVAWPRGCADIDILEYFSNIPYMKGAHFLRAAERAVGRTNIDRALAEFFQQNVGRAATMQSLINQIEEESGFDLEACADDWLRSEQLPANIDAACR